MGSPSLFIVQTLASKLYQFRLHWTSTCKISEIEVKSALDCTKLLIIRSIAARNWIRKFYADNIQYQLISTCPPAIHKWEAILFSEIDFLFYGGLIASLASYNPPVSSPNTQSFTEDWKIILYFTSEYSIELNYFCRTNATRTFPYNLVWSRYFPTSNLRQPTFYSSFARLW